MAEFTAVSAEIRCSRIPHRRPLCVDIGRDDEEPPTRRCWAALGATNLRRHSVAARRRACGVLHTAHRFMRPRHKPWRGTRFSIPWDTDQGPTSLRDACAPKPSRYRADDRRQNFRRCRPWFRSSESRGSRSCQEIGEPSSPMSLLVLVPVALCLGLCLIPAWLLRRTKLPPCPGLFHRVRAHPAGGDSERLSRL